MAAAHLRAAKVAQRREPDRRGRVALGLRNRRRAQHDLVVRDAQQRFEHVLKLEVVELAVAVAVVPLHDGLELAVVAERVRAGQLLHGRAQLRNAERAILRRAVEALEDATPIASAPARDGRRSHRRRGSALASRRRSHTRMRENKGAHPETV